MADEKNFPAVSIIVPMYNVEKFIGECLDSILAQTFKNYELLVVDDCSTDKSCSIVESYIPKFEGRLNLIKSEKNSGGCPGTPRNIAIDIAHGEYIMFVDSDDVITPTALEELYPIAKNFDADLLQCEKYFEVLGEVIPKGENLNVVSEGWKEEEMVKKPSLMSDSLEDRVEYYGFKKLFPVPWNRLFRREFLIKNNIKYPKFKIGSDLIFGFFVLCLAKNIVRVPNVYYIWRKRFNSVSRLDLPLEKMLTHWTDTTFGGIPILDKFMDGFEIFCKHPEYKYLAFEAPVYFNLRNLFPLYEDVPNVRLGGFIPAAKIDTIIRPMLEKIEDKTALLTIFFNRMNFFQARSLKFHLQAIEQQEKITQLQEQIKELQSKLE